MTVSKNTVKIHNKQIVANRNSTDIVRLLWNHCTERVKNKDPKNINFIGLVKGYKDLTEYPLKTCTEHVKTYIATGRIKYIEGNEEKYYELRDSKNL